MDAGFGKFKVSKRVQKKLDDKEWLANEFASGKSAQEIMEFSDEAMKEFYRAAFFLYENKRYADASNAFMFLVTLNPYEYDYWLGLGMALQMCHEYESAIDAYEMAASRRLDSPVPYFYLAKCFFAIHDHESAMSALDLALEYSEKGEEYIELHRQAIAAKKILQK